MTSKVFYNTDNYCVVLTDKALNEAGTGLDAEGYAVVNKETGITEHTTLCLPAAMFQADNFNRTLTQLLAENEETEEPELETPVEDVTVN